MNNINNEPEKNETKPKSYYYTNRLQILFDSEFPTNKETFKPFFLAMLGERLTNISIKVKKVGLMETRYEDENF